MSFHKFSSQLHWFFFQQYLRLINVFRPNLVTLNGTKRDILIFRSKIIPFIVKSFKLAFNRLQLNPALNVISD